MVEYCANAGVDVQKDGSKKVLFAVCFTVFSPSVLWVKINHLFNLLLGDLNSGIPIPS